MIKNAAHKTLRVSYALIGIVVIVLALLTIVARVALPIVAKDKSGVETRVSDYLQSPVSIGELSMRWTGFGPVLHASDVVIEDKAQRNVTLDQLLIDIDVPASLLRGELQIKELSMVGADLLIEHNAQGQFQLYGLNQPAHHAANTDQRPKPEQSGFLEGISWLLKVQKIALLDTQVTLFDQSSNQRFVVDDINLRVDNTGQVHQLRVDAKLPDSLGARVEIGVDLHGSVEQLAQLTGDLYVKANALDLQGARALLAVFGHSDLWPVSLANVNAGASVELWGTWGQGHPQGRLSSLHGPVTVMNAERTDTGEALFDSAELELHLSNTDTLTQVVASALTLSQGGQSMSVDEVRFSRHNHVPITTRSEDQALESQDGVTLVDMPANSPSWQLRVESDVIPLDVLTSVFAGVLTDIRPAWSDVLQETSVSGALNDVLLGLSASDQGPLISLSANTRNLEVTGNTRLPEFGPVSGTVSLVDSQGTVEFAGEQVSLHWPMASDQQLQVDRISTVWDIDARDTGTVTLAGDVQLDDETLSTHTSLNVKFTLGTAPHLDIRSRFEAFDMTDLIAWLPEKRLSPAAVDWVQRAIVDGEVQAGQVLFFGYADEFPFEKGEGVLSASVNINNGTLAFLPDWPDVSGINAILELDGLTLTGTVADQAVLTPFNLSSASFGIDNILAPVLDLAGTAEGALPDFTDFAITGPLADILAPAMSDISGTGDTQMDLALTVPLFDQPATGETGPLADSWKPFKINGSVFLADNDITFHHAGLVLRAASGAVGFNENGIAINRVEGDVLGHQVRLMGETTGVGSEGTTSFSLSGIMEANDLLAYYENPLDQFIRGASFWNIDIKVPHSSARLASEGVQLEISSDLVGSQLLLPAPYNKPTSASVPFYLSTQFKSTASRQQWLADYGDQLLATVNLVDEQVQSVLIDLGRGDSILTSSPFGQNDPVTGQRTFEGIRLQGRVARLSADGWIETVAKYIDSLPASDEDDQSPILPVSADLAVDTLVLGSTSFGTASLQASTAAAYLSMNVSNEAIEGNLHYPRRHWEPQTPLKVELNLLDWSVIEALQGDDSPVAGSAKSVPLDPRVLPPIDARLSLLRRDNLQLHDLAMRSEPNVSGMDITALGFAYDTMRLVGEGHWYLRDPQQINSFAVPRHSTQLDLVVQGDDFGVALDSVGLTGILDDTQGSIQMQLGWPGALYQPDIASLDGTIDLDLKAGSIVPLEPGAGRIVGLFALQALPRRLNLDFKDITSGGLAFTRIAGSATIEDGVVETPLLQLTGPIGVVDITGTSDLNARQFDQKVTVLPRVSAALPIIGAISGGASAGIGALVATGLLKAMGVDFDRIGLRTYELTGPWTQPVLTSVASDIMGRR